MKVPRLRIDGTERGFTLVETIATVVIMGLVMGPLAMTVVQALNLVPQSGQTTQNATDNQRVLTQFADDIAQAQLLVQYNPWSAPFWEIGNPPWWTTSNTSPTACSGAATSASLLDDYWADKSQGAGAATSRSSYVLQFAPVSGSTTLATVELDRQYWAAWPGGTPPPDTTTKLQSGYCNYGLGGDTQTATVVSIAPDHQATFNEQIQMTLNLRGSSGVMQTAVTLDGTVRAAS